MYSFIILLYIQEEKKIILILILIIIIQKFLFYNYLYFSLKIILSIIFNLSMEKIKLSIFSL